MRPNNICCIGGDTKGRLVCCAIALKCPEIRITVLDNKQNIADWNSNVFPIQEPDFEQVVKKCRNRNLFFSSQYDIAIKDADLIFVSIDVPIRKGIGREGKTMDYQELEEAAKLIAFHSESDKIVVEKSDISARAAEKLINILKANSQAGVRFQVLSNPEFLSEGTALKSLLFPERVVIGCQNNPNGRAAAESLCELYERWVPRKNIIIMSHWSSELYKLAAYAFLAQRLCSVNALATICEESGADISEITEILAQDSRIGSKYLNPSLGFGGFQTYISNLVFMCECLKLHEVANYWQAVIDMNESQVKRFIEKIQQIFGCVKGSLITVFGFSYKKNSYDTKHSPAVEVCKWLLKQRALIKIYDSKVSSKQIYQDLALDQIDAKESNVQICEDMYMAITGSCGLILCTDGEEFLNIDYGRVAKWMKRPVIIDGRKFLKASAATDVGIEYHTIGIGKTKDVEPEAPKEPPVREGQPEIVSEF